MTGIDSIFKGSAYLLGAATGVALMVPLAAGALATGSMTRVAPQAMAIEAFGPEAGARQAHLVNRSGKGARLDVAPRPAVSSRPKMSSDSPAVIVPVRAPASTQTPTVVTNQPEIAPVAPARATRTPKGCLSALGVTKSSLSTEELTVCVADASMIGRG
ncbi:hypothetical protein EV667_0625 [Ancylobacter aquaticus]|uniref:Uncharacterized protein n=1 Tax=Ancylobacter aquaticus TaxID=100 RepID=A0A4R1I5A7_ANCAQ|nr:hypothetical protein [Ancylobacter aquaticus]TCK30534.1 hypothetical protein EV667_0625 [Ancylobacter aquaticus]